MSRSETAATPLLSGAISELQALLTSLAPVAGPTLDRMCEGCARALERGGKLMLAGNGGSAAQCQHLAAELTCRFSADRAAYAAIALTTDTSFLTACANDYTFEHVFARQVEALGRRGDILMLLSTGGRSPNVLRAAGAGRERGIEVYAFTGESGSELAALCDEAILVPSGHPARIQEAHLLLGHQLCAGIESRLDSV
ncbi:MAG TPA: SIS domain-containing protein [Gemmatimonadota bacterium]|nr:SIS domain-containing protein [Gemmatimonadota bacterium]